MPASKTEKLVASFQFPFSTPVEATPERSLVWHSEYQGDRTDEWILEIQGGKEVARHNVRHIASVRWVTNVLTSEEQGG